MKLTKFKGIMHDLAKSLDYQIWFGYYKDVQKEFTTDVIQNKDPFSEMCLEFFKERLPKSFDIKRIKELVIKVKRSMTALSINIKVKADDKEFSKAHMSTIGH